MRTAGGVAVVVGVVLLFGAAAGWAQQVRESEENARWERMLRRWAEGLQLTPQQQEQLRQLFQERQEQIRRHREQMRQEREQFRERLRAVLTPQQWEKLQQLWKERRDELKERWKKRHHRRDGAMEREERESLLY